VAATDELTEDLDLARRALDDLHGEVGLIGPWERREASGWRLRFELRPDDLDPVGAVPPTTAWYALIDDDYPAGGIDIFPAKEGGIIETFAHQLPNEPGADDEPWRTGKVCLVDTVRGHELAAARDEPNTAYERLVWHVWRTIGWLRRASRDELLMRGEPFELPVFGQFQDGPTIAFVEGLDTFDAWQASPLTNGLADLVRISDDKNRPALAVVAWRDLLKREAVRPLWGNRIATSKVAETALWFRFERLLMRPPWRAPQTWQEVHDFAAEQGVDFSALLRQATPVVRDGKPHYVLLGFPVERVTGEVPSRYHWVAFLLPALSRDKRAKTQVPGFRTPVAAWMTDRRTGALAGDAPLGWVRAENWHPDELAARGRFEGRLAGRGVVLLGAGAFGSVLGDLLVRGGVHDLAIFDAERLEAGNLARHELSMLEHGALKAEALAKRLNTVSPSARVSGYGSAFPPSDDDARAALDRAEIVIDASASDRVAEALGKYPWGRDRKFASVSFSYGAEKLYFYLAKGPAFPTEDFRTEMKPWIEADTRPPEDFPHEGTGCWSSVFPARGDDVALFAAIAARQLDERLATSVDAPELAVYARQPDGTVAILHRPPAATRMNRFLAADRSVAVDLERGAVQAMLDMCARAGRLETGGVLVGRYSEFGDRVVVMNVTGSPGDSRHFPFSFIRGIAGLTRRLRHGWDEGVYYVGEWHFHPFATPKPSGTDIKQIKTFATDSDLRCPRPVLVVLGGDPRAMWSLTVGVVMDAAVVNLKEEPAVQT
jgi:hypothetical protein